MMELYSKEALLSAIDSSEKPVALLIGSPLSAGPEGKGVPGTQAILEIIRDAVTKLTPSRLARYGGAEGSRLNT
jgi:hypothetical protein